MNIKEQVLSIKQVQELQELGFDVEKNASVRWCDCSVCKRTYAPCFSYNELRVDKKECPLTREVPTLTIGDIMDILPKVINSHGIEYGRNADYGLSLIYLNKYYIRYIGIHISLALIIFESYNLIDVLFEALKWCIKEKHIEL